MKSEAKCPFNHAVVGDATTNRDWGRTSCAWTF